MQSKDPRPLFKKRKMKARREYNVLLENGELLELYPELSGSWSKDGKLFTSLWEQNRDAIMEIDFDYEED